MFRALILIYCLLFSGTIQVFAQRSATPTQTPNTPSAKTQTQAGQIRTPPQIQRSVPVDVIIGKPQPIPYSRAFPLLDGIFQDVSAIQLKQLQLDANVANASNLNALIEQFQATIQYSQTAGIQNAAAAQQSAAYSASGALQTQLINQETQLINLQLNAQQQVGQAQMALNSLPSTATTEQKASAQQSVTLATDNLNSINQQIANVKTLLLTTAAPTYAAPTPSPMSFPSPPVTLSTPGGNTFSPSFPASKQMENQVNLLWERLAHLVRTLAQTDNPSSISLVEFHTGITAGKDKRKHQLLSTQYSLKCSASQESPQALDLFPRNAAVNITDQKYKDSRFGLGALLSFFSIGANVSYNREHLRITQALGQTGYITGFGIQTDSFGWVFGPTLGEDVIAPGDRATFALVAAPKGCGQVTINLTNAAWDKGPVTVDQNQDPAIKDLKSWAADPESIQKCDQCIRRIAYTPAEYNPSTPNTGAVTVDLTLTVDLDREETISVNGIILRRARDTFGRATTGAGSGGLLQATSLEAGTWIPVSSKELILTLNPSLFTRQFPSILLNSPNGSIDVNSQISDKTVIDVAGLTYTCPSGMTASCASVLPAVGRPNATVRHFAVARWVGTPTRFIITLPDALSPATNPAASGALPALQVITDSRNQPWSAQAKVLASQNQGSTNVPLQCEPRGERLICEAGQLRQGTRTEFEIFDSDYTGGPVKGSALLEGCVASQCADPLIWQMSPPKWDENKSWWNFHLSLINVQDGETAMLNDGAFSGAIHCTSADQPCQVDIHLPIDQFGLVTDSMSLQVMKGTERIGGSSVIGNLLVAISPILSSISDDQTHFTGQNLVFGEIQVGKSGKPITITCARAIDCFIPQPGFGPKEEGHLYFVTGSTPVPLMLISDKGLQVVPPHKKAAQSAAATTTPSSGPSTTAPQTPTQQIQNNPDTRIYSIKEP